MHFKTIIIRFILKQFHQICVLVDKQQYNYPYSIIFVLADITRLPNLLFGTNKTTVLKRYARKTTLFHVILYLKIFQFR